MGDIGATDPREQILADSQFGSGSTTYSPATWYFALSTTEPNDDGTNFTEPSGGSYARVSVTNNSTNFPAASTSSGVTTKTNGTDIEFPDPTGTWGTVTHWGWFTGSSGGTAQYVGRLDKSSTITASSDSVEILAGSLIMPFA